MRSKNRAIDDEMIKVQIGTAGRSHKELDADMKLLDDQERREKMLKVSANEKRRKLKEKEQRFRQSQLARNSDYNYGDEEEAMSEDEDREHTSNGDVQTKMVRKSTSDHNQMPRQEQEFDPEYKKRLTSNEKAKMKKKELKEERNTYLMLNAREIIPFGERIDAPPKFSDAILKRLDPLHVPNGKKRLLLNSMFKSSKSNKPSYSAKFSDDDEDQSSGVITAEDRLRTIQAYRQLKKDRR